MTSALRGEGNVMLSTVRFILGLEALHGPGVSNPQFKPNEVFSVRFLVQTEGYIREVA